MVVVGDIWLWDEDRCWQKLWNDGRRWWVTDASRIGKGGWQQVMVEWWWWWCLTREKREKRKAEEGGKEGWMVITTHS